jgi:hypothetical protein
MANSDIKIPVWHDVEEAIAHEVDWLKRSIIVNSRVPSGQCLECLFRRIATLIVAGMIVAKDIKTTCLIWGENATKSQFKAHGKEWHANTINNLYNYFNSKNYKVIFEPHLNYGRADLGVFKEEERNLYVEVGSVSLQKLICNLESMDKSDFLLVVDEWRAIEFSIKQANFNKYYFLND